MLPHLMNLTFISLSSPPSVIQLLR
jgi:hypothetical protein